MCWKKRPSNFFKRTRPCKLFQAAPRELNHFGRNELPADALTCGLGVLVALVAAFCRSGGPNLTRGTQTITQIYVGEISILSALNPEAPLPSGLDHEPTENDLFKQDYVQHGHRAPRVSRERNGA